jgi:rhodanese-related sulfurtransferase
METISPKQLNRYLEDPDVLLVDLRSRQEYRSGHIAGAINVPQGEFRGELQGWRNRTVILYCQRGSLSMAVARELEQKGFRVKSLVGGYHAYSGEELL